MTYKELGQKALGLPEEPGVYMMKNDEGKIIYVGKAIVLRRRVYSYFSSPEKHTPKTAALVSHIRDFDVIVARSELEALLLENNLIKKNKPKYNILLKDDKGYPFIRLSGGDWPTLHLARKTGETGEYFGPFYGSRSANAIMEAANRAFLLPTCKDPAPKAGRRACLNYRIGRCVGSCAGKIGKEEYAAVAADVRAFLQGDIESIVVDTTAKMEAASEALDFERAAVLRDRLRAVRTLLEKQRVASDRAVSGDYVALLTGGGLYVAYLLRVDKGLLVGKHSFSVKAGEAESEAEFLAEYLKRYYGGNPALIPKRVVCRDLPEDRAAIEEYLTALAGRKTHIFAPRLAADTALCEMALRNAKEELIIKEGRTKEEERALFDLMQLLGLREVESIEIYDISHQSGTDVVCGMAVFGRGGFLRERYKKFRIAANAGDDCACMKEAVSRRVKRYIDGDENFTPLPSAIFADGGLAQVRAVKEALAGQGVSLPVYGLKKDSRHRTKSLVFEDGREVLLYKHPTVFPLCGRMQEQAHRFAVAYHTQAARKRSIESMFTSVEGIGKARTAAIMKHFRTLAAVKAASAEELAAVKGIDQKTAEALYAFLRKTFPNE